MEQESARIRGETGKQIEKLQQQGEQEIEAAGKTARLELKAYTAELALQLAEQLVRARLDAATEAGLVEDFIHDLKGQERFDGAEGVAELDVVRGGNTIREGARGRGRYAGFRALIRSACSRSFTQSQNPLLIARWNCVQRFFLPRYLPAGSGQ